MDLEEYNPPSHPPLPIIYLKGLHNITITEEEGDNISIYFTDTTRGVVQKYSEYTSDKFRSITLDSITGVLNVNTKLLHILVTYSDKIHINIRDHPISPIEIYDCDTITLTFMECECKNVILYTELSHNITVKYSSSTESFKALITHSTNIEFYCDEKLTLIHDKIFWDFGEIVEITL